MADTNKPLSRFEITSFGGGGGGNVPGADELMSRAFYLLNQISDLEAKMDELYMRPRMEHTDPAWVGFLLFFDPPIGDKPADDRPRWWLAPGETSDHNTGTESTSVTGTANEKNIVVHKSRKLEKVINDTKTKRKIKHINRYVNTLTSPTTTTTTTSTTTVSTTTNSFISFNTISTTTPTTTTTTLTATDQGIQKIKDKYHFTGDTWVQTDTVTTTEWDNTTFTPGTVTETETDTTDETISTTTIPTTTTSIILTTTNTFTP